MIDEGTDINWTGVSEATARQIMMQGETFMQAQLQAAIAADSRATAMAGLYTTLALAVLGAGFGYSDSTDSDSALYAGLFAGVFLIFAAVFANWAARPCDFYLPGNQPSQWFPVKRVALNKLLGGEAENYEARITFNESTLASNKRALERAHIAAILSPISGIAGWLFGLCAWL
jgi:hypothetical protein